VGAGAEREAGDRRRCRRRRRRGRHATVSAATRYCDLDGEAATRRWCCAGHGGGRRGSRGGGGRRGGARGSAGPGSAQHLALELFKLQAKVDALHVPYKGTGPPPVDLIRCTM